MIASYRIHLLAFRRAKKKPGDSTNPSDLKQNLQVKPKSIHLYYQCKRICTLFSFPNSWNLCHYYFDLSLTSSSPFWTALSHNLSTISSVLSRTSLQSTFCTHLILFSISSFHTSFIVSTRLGRSARGSGFLGSDGGRRTESRMSRDSWRTFELMDASCCIRRAERYAVQPANTVPASYYESQHLCDRNSIGRLYKSLYPTHCGGVDGWERSCLVEGMWWYHKKWFWAVLCVERASRLWTLEATERRDTCDFRNREFSTSQNIYLSFARCFSSTDMIYSERKENLEESWYLQKNCQKPRLLTHGHLTMPPKKPTYDIDFTLKRVCFYICTAVYSINASRYLERPPSAPYKEKSSKLHWMDTMFTFKPPRAWARAYAFNCLQYKQNTGLQSLYHPYCPLWYNGRGKRKCPG